MPLFRFNFILIRFAARGMPSCHIACSLFRCGFTINSRREYEHIKNGGIGYYILPEVLSTLVENLQDLRDDKKGKLLIHFNQPM